ncbi:MAG TPA: hypothetical protein V6C81_21575 [Planktothrix sp.]
MKPTLITFTTAPAGKCDVELLDFALTGLAMGAVDRSPRFLNCGLFRRAQYTQFVLTFRSGKRVVFQPFRPVFVKNQAGQFTVTCNDRYRSQFAREILKQLGFAIVNVDLGDGLDEPVGDCKMSYTCTLNGRHAEVNIVGSSMEPAQH